MEILTGRVIAYMDQRSEARVCGHDGFSEPDRAYGPG